MSYRAGGLRILLPILLAVASSVSGQQANDSGVSVTQELLVPQRQYRVDPIVRSCPEGADCRSRGLSIRAYAFSDGERPKLNYITDCPFLNLPTQIQVRKRGTENDQISPSMRLIKWSSSGSTLARTDCLECRTVSPLRDSLPELEGCNLERNHGLAPPQSPDFGSSWTRFRNERHKVSIAAP